MSDQHIPTPLDVDEYLRNTQDQERRLNHHEVRCIVLKEVVRWTGVHRMQERLAWTEMAAEHVKVANLYADLAYPPPSAAKPSEACSVCGVDPTKKEGWSAVAARTRLLDGKRYCYPCAGKLPPEVIDRHFDKPQPSAAEPKAPPWPRACEVPGCPIAGHHWHELPDEGT